MGALVRRSVSEREKQSGYTVDLSFEGLEPKTLNYTEKLCIYRFLQEGLSNAFRHAGVETAKVTITGSLQGVGVEIQDLGIGFYANEPNRLNAEGGQGLIGLKDRAESIGGSLNIESTIGRGTILTLQIATEDKV